MTNGNITIMTKLGTRAGDMDLSSLHRVELHRHRVCLTVTRPSSLEPAPTQPRSPVNWPGWASELSVISWPSVAQPRLHLNMKMMMVPCLHGSHLDSELTTLDLHLLKVSLSSNKSPHLSSHSTCKDKRWYFCNTPLHYHLNLPYCPC